MNKSFKKEFGLLEVFCIAAGTMISSGLFILPFLAFAKAGPSIILSYCLAGLFMLPTIFSQIELATAMPKSGGTYFFIERGLGGPFGVFSGLANWFSISCKSAFALIGVGAFLKLFFPDISYFHVKVIAISFCIFFVLLNTFSLKQTGRVQVYLVLLLFAVLLAYMGSGFKHINIHNYSGFMSGGFKPVFAVAGLVFVSYGGLTKISSVADEIRNPKKNIPAGILLAFFVVELLYLGIVFVTVGVLSPAQFKDALLPLSKAASVFWAKPGLLALGFAGLIAFVTTANAGILSSSRVPPAMAKDELLPVFLAKLSKKFKVPYVSVIFTGMLMISMILFLDIVNLVKTASTFMLILFIFVNISVIVMRESRVTNYKPSFKSFFYPYIQIIGVILYIFLIFEMGRVPLMITGFFAAGSVLWYFIYAKPKVKRISALMHVVERMTAKEIAGPTLEEELKNIVIERDDIIQDRLDRLVKECPVVDLKGPISQNDFFRIAAERLSPITGLDEYKINALLVKREAESTTVLRPGLSVPHIIIEEENVFSMLIIRCREGITFNTGGIPVYISFVLAGSIDERNFHLKVLMAIAQITQNPSFDKLWFQARDENSLRDIILTSQRRRHS